MARPNKVGLDYFSMDTDFFEDHKIKILLSKYGADGITVYLKILNAAYKEYGYYMPADEDNLLILAGELNIDYDKLKEIVEFQVTKTLFSGDLYSNYGILSSRRMQLNYLSGTEKRAKITFHSDYLLIDPKSEKGKNHKADIEIFSFGERKPIFPTPETIVSDRISTQSESESESEIETESKKKVKETGKQSTSETFFSQTSFEELSTSHFELVKNLFATHTRIKDPNEDTHVKPIVNFFARIPERLTESDISSCIEAAFSKLSPEKGVMMEYLINNIQQKITARHEEILDNDKKKLIKQANIDRNEEKKKLAEDNERYLKEKLKEYKAFLDKNLNMFNAREKEELLRLFRENKVLQAGSIIEPKMESAELV